MEFYLLSPHPEAHMMGFAFRTDGGRLLLIDGGMEDLQGDLGCTGYLWETLCRITGSDRPHVDAWILTHPHGDHVSEFSRMCRLHPGEFSIGAVYQNFPDVDLLPEEMKIPEEDKALVRQLVRNYDACFGPGAFAALKPVSNGDRFELDGLEIEILSAPVWPDFNNLNNASVVFRVTAAGQRFFFPGDICVTGVRHLLAAVDEADLQSDVCQLAHHGHGGARHGFYASVRPKFSIICTQKSLWDDRENNELAQVLAEPEVAASRLLVVGRDAPCVFTLPLEADAVGRPI